MERNIVRGRSTLSKRYNLILQKALAKANDIITAYHLSNKELTPKIFKEEYQHDVSRDDFLAYWEREMQSQYNRRIFGESLQNPHTQIDMATHSQCSYCQI